VTARQAFVSLVSLVVVVPVVVGSGDVPVVAGFPRGDAMAVLLDELVRRYDDLVKRSAELRSYL